MQDLNIVNSGVNLNRKLVMKHGHLYRKAYLVLDTILKDDTSCCGIVI